MTEEEAHRCWCPFARILSGTESGGKAHVAQGKSALNRLDLAPGTVTLPAAAVCVGSRYMAWRWDGRKNIGPTKDTLPWVEGNDHDGYQAVAERTGHCGLAGPV